LAQSLLGIAWTYESCLDLDGTAVNEDCDFTFTLEPSAATSSDRFQIGPTRTKENWQ
jgi:hypothetical protein